MRVIHTLKPLPKIALHRPRVACYIRVSVDHEENLGSLNAQGEYYCSLIKSTPAWEFSGLYSDQGISGTRGDRPGFKALISDCEKGLIDIIITKSVSRFARNTVLLLDTIRHLKALGIAVRFQRENIDTMSADGEVLLTLLASFAEAESRSVSDNMKWSIRKGFEEGRLNQFFLYGYRWNGHGFDLVNNEAEAVKKAFGLYLDGLSPSGIAEALNNMGYSPYKGGRFSYSTVWDMLRQEKYTGCSLLQKTFRDNPLTHRTLVNRGELPMFLVQGTHPQIISKEAFDAVQMEIARRKDLGCFASGGVQPALFTGKLVCSICGHAYRRKVESMKSRVTKSYKWICGAKRDHGSSFCSGQNISESILIEITSEVLCADELLPGMLDCIQCIMVSRPNTLTFRFTDGHEVVRTWLCRSRNPKYKEMINGEISYQDSSQGQIPDLRRHICIPG